MLPPANRSTVPGTTGRNNPTAPRTKRVHPRARRASCRKAVRNSRFIAPCMMNLRSSAISPANSRACFRFERRLSDSRRPARTLGLVTRQLQLPLQLSHPLLRLCVGKELVHRLLHVFGAICDGRHLVAVLRAIDDVAVLIELNDGRLCACRHLCRMRGHFLDRLLLPGKYAVLYPLQLSGASSHRVDVALDFVKVVGMTHPAGLIVAGGGFQSVGVVA